jgi:hypothetical protein
MSHDALDLSADRPCWGRLEGAVVTGNWLQVKSDTPEQIAAALLAETGKPTDLIVLLGMRVARVVFLESLPARTAKEVVLAQAARLLRAAPDAVTVDSQHVADGMVLAAARTEPVTSLRAALEAAGFRVAAAEPSGASFIRALAVDHPVLAVRLGAAEAEMTAAHGHRIWFSRRCSWTGVEALALEIAETVREQRAPEGLEVVLSGLGAEDIADKLSLPWPYRLASVSSDLGIEAAQHLVPVAGALVGRSTGRGLFASRPRLHRPRPADRTVAAETGPVLNLSIFRRWRP